MSRTARLEDDAANEIERLREEAGYAKLTYDKRMAEKLTRAEAVIEAARRHFCHQNGCVICKALAAYDKDRGND